uniref:Uncharacterized protein n=1 Tax=Octopus bimaculoides TaxID=37653 RepID=A0A0L8HYC2_OCTBM
MHKHVFYAYVLSSYPSIYIPINIHLLSSYILGCRYMHMCACMVCIAIRGCAC